MEENVQGLSTDMPDVPFDPSTVLADGLSGHTVRERSRVLRQTADLFLSKSASYSDQQVKLFDSVMLQLLDHVDQEVREYLSKRFARRQRAASGRQVSGERRRHHGRRPCAAAITLFG